MTHIEATVTQEATNDIKQEVRPLDSSEKQKFITSTRGGAEATKKSPHPEDAESIAQNENPKTDIITDGDES